MRYYQRLGLGLLLAAFALTPNCPGSDSSTGSTTNFTLTVTRPTNGRIDVGAPVDATCNSPTSSTAGDCTYTLAEGTEVTLTAEADRGYEFTSWGDDCSGMSDNECDLTMDAARTASATFTSTLRTLTVTPPTNGSIAVVGTPVDMTCNSGDTNCTYSMIPDGRMVTLTATGEAGYTFDSWSTCPDMESGNTCTLTMDADKTAGASFVTCDLSNDDLDCDDDGTNNGDDDFPIDRCASTDTDGDGSPDSIIDSCSTTLIADAFPDNADVQGAIALFSLGEMDGDFGFDACQNFLNERTSPKPRADDMYGRGFRTAKFYGSTPDYHFPDLHTNAEGLNLMTSAEFRLPVAAFMEVSAGSTHSFPVSSGTTRITIADLVAVDSGGAWTTTNLFTNALDPIISDAGNLFWSFTSNRVYDASTSCSGATSMSTGFGRRGTRDAIGSSSGSGCSSPLDVLCVARR